MPALAKPSKRGLTPRQRLFLNEYIRNGYNGRQAYMFTHPKAKPETADSAASRLLAEPSAKEYLQGIIRYDVGITRQSVEETLLWACERAKSKDDHVGGASIAMDQAKLAGFLIDRQEVKQIDDAAKQPIRQLVADVLAPKPSN